MYCTSDVGSLLGLEKYFKFTMFIDLRLDVDYEARVVVERVPGATQLSIEPKKKLLLKTYKILQLVFRGLDAVQTSKNEF